MSTYSINPVERLLIDDMDYRPEISGQSNIDPQTAASLWQQNIQPKKQLGYNLISPAVTSDAAGIPWLQQFFQACQGCTVSLGRCSQMTPLIACISSMGSLCTGTALIRMLSCPMSRTFTPHSTFRFILPSSRIRYYSFCHLVFL